MIIKNVSILTENMEVKTGQDVVTSDAFIKSITDNKGNERSLSEFDADSGDEIIDGSDYLMMPGFFNAHGHSPMSLMRGYGENMVLQDWLFNKIFPFEDCLTTEAVYYGTLLSMAESFKYGIVSTSDMYYFLDGMAAAVKDSGAKANISRAVANPTGLPIDEVVGYRETIEAYEKYNGSCDGRIKIDASIHAEYTSDEKTVIALANLSKELGAIMHVHASETKNEHEECKARHEGRTPIKYFADCGLLDVPSIAAHCVWVEDEDRIILRDKGVVVATNPVSNLKLASGICDVKALMDAGVMVALGTDSVASNNQLSMFEEMKTMVLLAKVKNNDPTVLEPREALGIATRHGAIAQGRNDSGIIKEGYRADFILLNKKSPNMVPAYDLVNNVVLSATDSDVYMTVIDGRIVYRNGEYLTIDIDDTIKGVEKSIKDILKRVQ